MSRQWRRRWRIRCAWSSKRWFFTRYLPCNGERIRGYEGMGLALDVQKGVRAKEAGKIWGEWV